MREVPITNALLSAGDQQIPPPACSSPITCHGSPLSRIRTQILVGALTSNRACASGELPGGTTATPLTASSKGPTSRKYAPRVRSKTATRRRALSATNTSDPCTAIPSGECSSDGCHCAWPAATTSSGWCAASTPHVAPKERTGCSVFASYTRTRWCRRSETKTSPPATATPSAIVICCIRCICCICCIWCICCICCVCCTCCICGTCAA
mmetsp:Transcript_5497/g.14611  ORF Transcript_5497/g.14611 Transcript_5497/m.14611 type:complete len:210 (-) Transcript_5497:26-655(-)